MLPSLTRLLIALLAMLLAGPAIAQQRNQCTVETNPPTPIFDQIDQGARDVTPPPPRISAFDTAILEVCGAWGSQVGREAVRNLLSDPAHADLMARLSHGLHDMLGPATPTQLADRISALWADPRGGAFTHVFCGEPKARLGGLHFAARIAELQKQGVVGRSACGRSRADAPVYALAMAFQRPSQGDWRIAPIKSFSTTLSAEEILLAGSRAALRLQSLPDAPQGCRLRAPDDVGPPYYLQVFMKKDGTLATLYPLAGEQCGTRPDQRCHCE